MSKEYPWVEEEGVAVIADIESVREVEGSVQGHWKIRRYVKGVFALQGAVAECCFYLGQRYPSFNISVRHMPSDTPLSVHISEMR